MPRSRPLGSELPVGRIAGPFGVRGELKCDPTSSGRIVFSAGARLRCDYGGKSTMVTLTSVREHKGRLLVCIEGVDDADAAEKLRGARFYAHREQLDVAPGEHLDVDLIGCAVESADGRRYGTVESVEHYPASDMLVVNGRMVPMVGAIVRSIDTAGKRIVIDPPAGLLD